MGPSLLKWIDTVSFKVAREEGKTKHKTDAVTKADAGVKSLYKATKDRMVDVPEKTNKRLKNESYVSHFSKNK